MPRRRSACVRSAPRSSAHSGFHGASSPRPPVSEPRPVSEPSTRAEPLALHDIDKRYGATHALVSVSLNVRAGTVHALLGENGAGKSTLMRIAYGMEHPDRGLITVEGVPARF